MPSLFDGLNAKDLTPSDLALLNKMFSKVQGGGALESAFQPPTAPATPGPNDIPKLEAMPVGQGSWFNRPFTPPSVQTFLKRETAKTADEQKSHEQIVGLIKANPIEFAGLTGNEFGTIQEAQNYLKIKQAAKLNESKLQETIRNNKAKEAAAANKGKQGNPLLTVPGSTGTTAPAAEGSIRNVGGKNFKRVGNAWVQQR